jgi:hypothetical protein
MKIILQSAVIVFVVILVLQTYESVKTRNVSVLCDPSEVESNECLSLGPLGAVNTEGIEFCARTFVKHSTELPRFIATQVRNRGKRT